MEVFDFLQYAFIQKAYIAGGAIALASSLLGLFLVLRKLSLIGDGLSHVSFGGLALGLFLGIYPLYIAFPLVLAAAWLIWRLIAKHDLYGDAAIGLVSAGGIAGGVILASLSRGFNIDLLSYLFGNILAISRSETISSIIVSLAITAITFIFYRDLASTTFDPEYAQASGLKKDRLDQLLLILTAISVALAIKVVGVMLVSALLIMPAIAALQAAKSFGQAIIMAVITGVASVIIGITCSFWFDLPAGATIILANFGFLGLAFIYKQLRR
jgi:zinc transport system permease protein